MSLKDVDPPDRLRGVTGNFQGDAIVDELAWRGLIAQTTDEEALRADLAAAPLTLYCGFDPTAESLHAGNLLQLTTLRRVLRAGPPPPGLPRGGAAPGGGPPAAPPPNGGSPHRADAARPGAGGAPPGGAW